MNNVTKICDTLWRLEIPYKDIFTTVYVLKGENGTILFDTADTQQDVEGQILPMLETIGVKAEELNFVFISHNHRDHAGGLKWVMEHYPRACILSRSTALQEQYADFNFHLPEDGELISGQFQVVTIPGHTYDSMALLDTQTNTLVTGDCLQLYGIFGSTDWACAISLPMEHRKAVEKVRGLGVECILTAHDYHPYGFCYRGREAVEKALDACVEPLEQIKSILVDNPDMNDAAVRETFNQMDHRPTVNVRVVAAVRNALDQGGF